MIRTIELFPELKDEMLSLLGSLSREDWLKPSPIPGRTVKDLLSHLTDGSLRRLSLQRDQHESTGVSVDIASYDDLVNYIQDLNRNWMDATDRLSPQILLDLYAYAEDGLHAFFKKLDPHAQALFSVAWAGEEESENWFDIAREYTEKWHHQMQIRMSLEAPLLMDQVYTEPLYDTFMLGLPHHFRFLKQFPEGESFRIGLRGTLEKNWLLVREPGKWRLETDTGIGSDHSVDLPDTLAWRLFTNTVRDKKAYRHELEIRGKEELALHILDYVAVMS